MSGSRMSHSRRVRRRKMACSYTFHRIVVTLVFSCLYSVCVAEKEYFFKKGHLWDNESSSQAQSQWMRYGNRLFTCGSGKFSLKMMETRDATRIFVEIEYMILSLRNNISGGLFLWSAISESSEDGDRAKTSKEILVSNVVTTRPTKTTVHFDIKEDDNFVQLSLSSKKACVNVYDVMVFSYVCPSNTSLSVKRTVAPREGFIEKSANCSIKQSGKPGSVVVAKCGSDGEWTKVEDKLGICTNDCDPGSELINDTCTVCQDGYYKDGRGTHACTQCPMNTVSEHTRTRCKCKPRYYRNSESGPCKTLPSQPKNLSYIRLPSNAIQLDWNSSSEDTHPSLHFRVKCQQYFDSTNWRPCHNISVGKRGTNVTKSPLKVHNLKNNTNYTFSVAAVNDISTQVEQENWMLAIIQVHLPGRARTHVPQADVSTTKSPFPKTSESTTRDDVLQIISEGTVSTREMTTEKTISSSTYEPGEIDAQNGNNTTELAPYIGIAIGVVLFIFVLLVIVHYRRKRTRKKTLDFEEGFLLNSCPQAYIDPMKYGNPEKAVRKFAKEIDRRVVRLEGVIGEGEFAKVHKGLLCRPNEPAVHVALKVLKPGSSAKNREDFLTEAAVMGQFKDLNIVALEGVVTISHPVMIITEFMHNGALSSYLAHHKNNFSEIELLGMARGISSGMKYLARMRFVHRDLAARNVLVNENMVCKVADFGLTRELEDSSQGEYVTQGGKIPIRWTAPEAYKHRRFTTASDVWSFGIVLWEIMSYADRPYGDWDNYMVMDQVTANYRLFAPTNCPKIVHQLMMECWKADRGQRPSFSDIVEMLDRWIRNPYLLKDYQYVTEKGRMADRKSCIAKSIREYLEVIKMDRYIDNFIDFGYTELYQIQNLTDDDLVGIGVPLVGHRNKIIKSLQEEKEQARPVHV